jgi:voltage-gated potassium channel
MNAATGDITYITRVEELVWGSILLALSLIIHGCGMVLTLHLTNNFDQRFRRSASFVAGIASIILGSWLIMAVHVVEVLMWSAFFQWKECFINFSTAVYFAGLQYTTVGSTLNLPKHWRLLEAMIASAGLLGFAWSTGVLMTLAQAFQNEQVQMLGERGLLRFGRRPATKTRSPPAQ